MVPVVLLCVLPMHVMWPCVSTMCVQSGLEEPAAPVEGGMLPTTETDVEGSKLKPESESEVEPGSNKWQYVESPVPEVRSAYVCACVRVCVCVCVCVCAICQPITVEKILLVCN